jgi:hypothetical protein
MDPSIAKPPAPKRQTFRGVGLVVLGALLFFGVGLLLWRMLPMLMHPGVSSGGTTFNGTASEGRQVALLLGAVCGFGALSCAFGVWLLTRRQDG